MFGVFGGAVNVVPAADALGARARGHGDREFRVVLFGLPELSL